MSNASATPAGPVAGGMPANAKKVLVALILSAGVANLNLAVANVALPTIGDAFDASQTELNLIAVGYSLGLAASVLYFGAIGDRYGRKMMLVAGLGLSVVASLVAAWAPNPEVLFGARVVGGLSAGMAYPTTLALITALWTGAARTRAIALWSAMGGGLSMLGPLLSGLSLQHWWWGSVFLLALPLVVVALPMVTTNVPAHVAEQSEKIDNLGGVLSIFLVGSLILSINFMPVSGAQKAALGLLLLAIVLAVLFVLRQRRAANPLYDLKVAARPTFWVAATAGIIVFGSLMGAAFVSQQFLQNVLEYDSVAAGAAILPAVFCMILVAPRSAKLVESKGSRQTLLTGQAAVLLAFLTMFLLWGETSSYWVIGFAYVFLGIGVGLAGTPSSNSLTGSVPVTRVGMASGTADLQRDLGGALMQSIFGALLTAGYASAMATAIGTSPQADQITSATQAQLTKSFAGAEATAAQFPQYTSEITAAARESFLQGDKLAYAAGIVAVLVGAALVAKFYPRHEEEKRLRQQYAEESQQLAAAQQAAE